MIFLLLRFLLLQRPSNFWSPEQMMMGYPDTAISNSTIWPLRGGDGARKPDQPGLQCSLSHTILHHLCSLFIKLSEMSKAENWMWMSINYHTRTSCTKGCTKSFLLYCGSMAFLTKMYQSPPYAQDTFLLIVMKSLHWCWLCVCHNYWLVGVWRALCNLCP